MRIFSIFDKNGNKVTSKHNKIGIYHRLQDAKAMVKMHVRSANRDLKRRKIANSRCELLHLEDYSIMEYELLEKGRHKV